MQVQADNENKRVISEDGTVISYNKIGQGPAVILVAAALSSRADTKRLARRLSENFTVINYDRRGRGLSGNTLPYSVDREVEDIDALISQVDGHASLFGSSSGSVLALTAANQLQAKVDGVVMFEPPFIVDDSRPPVGPPFEAQLNALLCNRDHAGAVRHFMRHAVGMPSVMVAMMRLFPGWKKMTAMAPTLPYDLAVMGDSQQGRPLRADRWPNVDMPALVITGAKSEDFFHTGAQQLVRSLRQAQHLRLDKANHAAVVAAPKRVAEAIVSFLAFTDR